MKITGRGIALVGLGLIVAFFAYNLWRFSNVQDQRDRDQAAQIENRVRNVHTWCVAINDGRDYQRARTIERRAVDPTITRYTLHNLNCRAIEKKTRESGRGDG